MDYIYSVPQAPIEVEETTSSNVKVSFKLIKDFDSIISSLSSKQKDIPLPQAFVYPDAPKKIIPIVPTVPTPTTPPIVPAPSVAVVPSHHHIVSTSRYENLTAFKTSIEKIIAGEMKDDELKEIGTEKGVAPIPLLGTTLPLPPDYDSSTDDKVLYDFLYKENERRYNIILKIKANRRAIEAKPPIPRTENEIMEDEKQLSLLTHYTTKLVKTQYAIMEHEKYNAERVSFGKHPVKGKDKRSGYRFATKRLASDIINPFENRSSIAGDDPPEDFEPEQLHMRERQIQLMHGKVTSMKKSMEQTTSKFDNVKTQEEAVEYIQQLREKGTVEVSSSFDPAMQSPSPETDYQVHAKEFNALLNGTDKTAIADCSYKDDDDDDEDSKHEKKKKFWKKLQKLHHPKEMRIWIYSGEIEFITMLGLFPWVTPSIFWPSDIHWQVGHYMHEICESKWDDDLIQNYHTQWKKSEKDSFINYDLPPCQKVFLNMHKKEREMETVNTMGKSNYHIILRDINSHLQQEHGIRVLETNGFLEAMVKFQSMWLSALTRPILHISLRERGIHGGGLNSSVPRPNASNVYKSRPADNQNAETEFSLYLSTIPGFPANATGVYFYARFGTFQAMVKELNALTHLKERIDILIQIHGVSESSAAKVIKKFCEPIVGEPLMNKDGYVGNSKKEEEDAIMRQEILKSMPKKKGYDVNKFYPHGMEKNVKVLIQQKIPAVKRKRIVQEEEEDNEYEPGVLKMTPNTKKKKRTPKSKKQTK